MTQPEFIFRQAVPADWDDIARLLDRYSLPLEGAREHLGDFLVARRPGESLAGVAGLEIYGEEALLRSVAVAEPGKGLGSQLVQHILAYARQGGIRQVVLLTTTAAEYFPRFGFERIPRSAVPPDLQKSAEFQGACPETAVVMKLDFILP